MNQTFDLAVENLSLVTSIATKQATSSRTSTRTPVNFLCQILAPGERYCAGPGSANGVQHSRVLRARGSRLYR